LLVIDLPVPTWETNAASALTLVFSVAAGLSPVDPLWQALLALATLMIGGLSYRIYRRRRPSAIETMPTGDLVFRYAASRRAVVSELRVGVVSPLLLAVRCRFSDGARGDLFVPAGVLTRQDHWRLRRAIIAFSNAQPRRGR